MTSQRPAQIIVPDVRGQDGDTVRKTLRRLGLTDVSMSSTNPQYGVVMLESCWTAVSIDPPPGTAVAPDDPVVVQVYKD
ncbi:PASTA domain-containing protein [Mycobacterium angelicum]|uniref:PASTA domain-containing protein n=1 Tax=Mycobacterium angelicum TaxID=470074 RepID=A0A1W9Z953_MYCAN|nr:PASTA domain-containing protein [Mycobacterium angelicum]MCV7195520.1 PASTA domain-containing protein [Mycobacterium angelicum]ORA09621.1 hypothetical protein BST12_27515 [Mycobacterium angelicum]